MTKDDAVTLASRALAVLLTAWALADLSYLPAYLQSFFYYLHDGSVLSPSPYTIFMRHQHAIGLGFLIVRIVAFSLTAKWLFKGGLDIHDLFLPRPQEDAGQN